MLNASSVSHATNVGAEEGSAVVTGAGVTSTGFTGAGVTGAGVEVDDDDDEEVEDEVVVVVVVVVGAVPAMQQSLTFCPSLDSQYSSVVSQKQPSVHTQRL